MKRREFIAILSGIVVTRPIAGVAQQMNMPVVGLLWASSKPEPGDRLMAGWWEGLGETGFVEGRNVFVEYRWGYERLPTLAADLVARKADVIFAAGGPAAFAAKAATSKIPIVFVVGGDPVGAGLVKSLNRPGGNTTG